MDSPRDLKHAATAMAVGRELATLVTSCRLDNDQLEGPSIHPKRSILTSPKALLAAEWRTSIADGKLTIEEGSDVLSKYGTLLREETMHNVRKVMAFRKSEERQEFLNLAVQAFDKTLAANKVGNVYVPDQKKADQLFSWNKQVTRRSATEDQITAPVVVPKLVRPTRAGERRYDGVKEGETAWARAMGEQKAVVRQHQVVWKRNAPSAVATA